MRPGSISEAVGTCSFAVRNRSTPPSVSPSRSIVVPRL